MVPRGHIQIAGQKEQGRDIRLANPAKIVQYEGIKQTDDHSDAAWLAELLRLGILPECYVYPKEIRPIRDALRRRQIFVRQRTQSLLSLQSFFARSGLDEPKAAELKTWTEADLDALHLSAFDQLQAASLLESVRQADRLAGRIEREVLAAANPVADFQTVQTIFWRPTRTGAARETATKGEGRLEPHLTFDVNREAIERILRNLGPWEQGVRETPSTGTPRFTIVLPSFLPARVGACQYHPKSDFLSNME